MKLPEIRSGAVEKFAPQNTQAAASAARAGMAATQAKFNMVSDVAEAGADMATLLLKRQRQNEQDSIKVARAKWLQDNTGKDYYTAEELPEGVVPVNGLYKKDTDENGNETEVARRIPRAEVFSQLYRKFMTDKIKAGSGNISGRQESEAFATEHTLALEDDITQLSAKEYEAMKETLRGEQVAKAEEFKRRGDWAAAKEVLSNFEGTDLEREKLAKQLEVDEILDYASQLEATDAKTIEDLDAIEEAVVDLRDLETDSPMPDEDRLQLADRLEKVSKRHPAHRAGAIAREEGTRISSLEMMIDQDPTKVLGSHIEAEFKRGFMTPEKRTQLHRKLQVRMTEGDKKADHDLRAQWYLGNNYMVGQADKDVQKALDRHTEAQIKAGADPLATFTHVAKQTGYIPEGARHIITGANNSYSPEMQEGVALYDQISKVSPASLWSIPEAQTDRLRSVNAAMRGGADFETAVRINQNWENMTKAEKDVVRETTRSKDFAKESASVLTDFISDTEGFTPSGFFSSAPEPTPVMMAEFNVMTERYMPAMGFNVAQAQARAWEDMRTTWGITATTQQGVEAGWLNNSNTLMKYPPQITPEHAKMNLEEKYGKGEFSVQSDFVTDRNVKDGIAPSYAVFKIDESTGLPVEQAMRWTPASGAAVEAAANQHKVATARETDIKRLKAKQVRIRDMVQRGLTSQDRGAAMIEEAAAELDAAIKARNEAKAGT